MLGYRIRLVILAVAAVLSRQVGVVLGETWHLEQGQDWKPVQAQSQEDRYLLAVAQIKKLANTGQTDALYKALDKLRKDFPEIAGPDLDAFIEAEMLFCKGKFVKAVRSYDKFLAEYPESELYEAALDRQFAIATAFLAGQKKPVLGIFKMKGYAEGAKIMEKISDRVGEAPIGAKAAISVAKSLERRGKFNKAYHKWSQISSQWPTGQIGKDALLSMARCKHAAYKGPKYDPSNLISAKSYYENFKLRYPEGAVEFDIDGKLKQINEQLAYKQFSIGQYYQKTDNRQSANFYYQMVVDNWPETTAAKMAKATIKDKKSSGKEDKRWEKSAIKKLEKLFL